MAFFSLGQTHPLPFFTKTSLAATEVYGKKQSQEGTLNKARTGYHGGRISKRQKDYTEAESVFGDEDTGPIEGVLSRRLTEELLVPLLDTMENSRSVEKTV